MDTTELTFGRWLTQLTCRCRAADAAATVFVSATVRAVASHHLPLATGQYYIARSYFLCVCVGNSRSPARQCTLTRINKHYCKNKRIQKQTRIKHGKSRNAMSHVFRLSVHWILCLHFSNEIIKWFSFVQRTPPTITVCVSSSWCFYCAAIY